MMEPIELAGAVFVVVVIIVILSVVTAAAIVAIAQIAKRLIVRVGTGPVLIGVTALFLLIHFALSAGVPT